MLENRPVLCIKSLDIVEKNEKLTLLCVSFYSVSEIKMEDILSVLTRDDCFPGKQWGKQVSLVIRYARCWQTRPASGLGSGGPVTGQLFVIK